VRDPLKKIPGPFFVRWNPFWLAFQCRLLRRSVKVDQLHKKYGPVVRIGPCHVSVATSNSFQQLYGARSGIFRGPFYDDKLI
jgi:benzoate 4-monooxygenase